MKRPKRRAVLLALLILALSLPAGFAIAQAVSSPEAEGPPPTRIDPDPSTDAIAAREALEEAWKSGDPESIARAEEAVREEGLSRLSEDERKVAESAPPEPDVPQGTKAYVAPEASPEQVERCRSIVKERGQDQLCELIVLHAEGRARAGAYSAEEVEQALQAEASEGGER